MDASYFKFFAGSGSSLLTGLQGYWKLDETSGVTLDDSIDTIDMITSGTVNATGKIGKGVTLSGTQSIYASHTSALTTLTNGISISCWIYLSSTPTSSEKIFNQVHSSSPWTSHSIWVDTSSKIQGVVINSSLTEYYFRTTNTLSTGTWYLITFTCSSTDSMNLYINATEASYDWNDGFSGTILDANGVTVFGNEANGESSCLIGTLDELAIWNRVISSSEITSLYNSGSGITYPF